MTTQMSIRGVLFDLDGTLLDTAPDMALALNRLRREQGRPAIAFDQIRPHVSHGALALIRIGFPDADQEQVESLRARFLELYRADLAAETRLFSGFESVLAELEARGLPWGVVTNKPAFLTEPLLAATKLSTRARCIVSGDTLPQRKPHPAPLLHAASLLELAAGDCVYLGDAERDVRAAHAAGMRALIALFGYLGEHDRPQSWGADALIDEPEQLIDWLNGAASPS